MMRNDWDSFRRLPAVSLRHGRILQHCSSRIPSVVDRPASCPSLPSDLTGFPIVIRNIVNFLPVAPDKVPEEKSEAWLNKHTVELKPLIDRISARELFELVATPQRMRNLLKPLEKFRKLGGRVNGFGY